MNYSLVQQETCLIYRFIPYNFTLYTHVYNLQIYTHIHTGDEEYDVIHLFDRFIVGHVYLWNRKRTFYESTKMVSGKQKGRRVSYVYSRHISPSRSGHEWEPTVFITPFLHSYVICRTKYLTFLDHIKSVNGTRSPLLIIAFSLRPQSPFSSPDLWTLILDFFYPSLYPSRTPSLMTFSNLSNSFCVIGVPQIFK